MAGSDGSTSAAAGQHELLRKATQAMMSRQAGEEETDHIDSDTPRSGIATPVPDPSDKRLPGIIHSSYFGQVGKGSSTSPSSVSLENKSVGSESEGPKSPHHSQKATNEMPPVATESTDEPKRVCDGNNEEEARKSLKDQMDARHVPAIHPYPTPPTSTTPSLHKVKLSDSSSEGERQLAIRKANPHRQSISDSFPSHSRRGSSMLNPLSSIVTTSNVHAAHFSNPSDPNPSTTPCSPVHPRSPLPVDASPSYDRLKALTDDGTVEKSIPGTPTRALSNQTAASDASTSTHSEKVAPTTTTSPPETTTSKGSSRSGSTAARGKLTVKIREARGIRRSLDPYVVAVFQRNELVSKGPRPDEEDEEEAKSPVGGIPISRTASDTGRPMAIPMKSRQSSNTSLTDYREFSKSKAKKTTTNPRWDTEAVFDVVGSDNHLNISVYDRGAEQEEFLGNVDLQPRLSEHDLSPINGWYGLHGRNAKEVKVSGEIYVEVSYERTEARHIGPEDFEILKLIGKGTFGQVYQVRKKDTKRIYAMKVLQKKVIVQKKEVAHTVGERNILVRTAMEESPFIVGLKFSFQTPTDLYLVTDYMSGGELFWHLQKEGRFNEERAKFYIAELILALQHLHMHDIVYRDLKPENILLDANGHIALCDFGLSKANLTKNDTTNTFCGTTEYLAPEVLLDEHGYTKMVDFWSLGVLVFEMCCGWSPFYAEDTQQMYKNIAFGKVRFPRDTLTTEGRNFVKGLLNRNPKHRLGAKDDAEELKRHPFFDDIDWDALAQKKITPPFKPKLRSETDTSNFDPEFTNAPTGASSLNARALALANGMSTSTPLSPGMQANFKGFTFVDESLDEHMRHRVRDDFDEMDEDQKQATDWEQPFDNDPKRRSDRMSGIQRTGTGEENGMFNQGHMDL